MQEAVATALEFDMQLAAALANRAEDTVIGRKLWLEIALHLITRVQDNPDSNPVSLTRLDPITFSASLIHPNPLRVVILSRLFLLPQSSNDGVT